ncbi:hypothetical protein BJY01DRAFT_136950 [Aspergillus pseudoustus]|uniref:Uncharacterized protein n=1 Tax=Aspergillus pseudoustus TaxID=1810923 RepID=A0ABR4KYF1_9EURO
MLFVIRLRGKSLGCAGEQLKLPPGPETRPAFFVVEDYWVDWRCRWRLIGALGW